MSEERDCSKYEMEICLNQKSSVLMMRFGIKYGAETFEFKYLSEPRWGETKMVGDPP
jgi:hypothetical protein